MPRRLISWNVNGLRAVLKKGFEDFFTQADADVVCLQETKCHPDQVEVDFPGYDIHWNCAEKKGYSGTAIITRVEPLNVTNGLGIEEHDDEGRVITAEFKDYYLVNVYTPNSKRGLERLEYRTREWDVAFLAHLKELEARKPVIFCGDLNVAHQEIDLANPKSNQNNAGFTPQERERFQAIVDAGFIDSFRTLHPDKVGYSWWSYMNRARERNIGWRIDYFGLSWGLRPRLKHAGILDHVHGSDHCPVELELHD